MLRVRILGAAYLASTTARKMWAQPPIDVSFEGHCVGANLKAFEKNDYQSVPGVILSQLSLNLRIDIFSSLRLQHPYL